MVADHDVDVVRALTGQLAVALGGHAAALRPEALMCADRDLPPGPFADAGDELVAIAGPGLFGPGAQPEHLTTQPGRRATAGRGGVRQVEEAVLVGGVAAGQ